MGRLAHFLADVADAWKQADQGQRNNLARGLFEEILAEDERVVAVRPRRGLEPFFKLNFERQTADIAGDPEGLRTLMQYLSVGLYPVIAPAHLMVAGH
jgi:hypothetical protein